MKKALLTALLAALAIVGRAQFFFAGTPYTNHHDIPDTLLYYTVTPSTNKTYSVNMFSTSAPDLVFTIRGAVSSGGSAQFIHVTAIHPSVYVRFSHYDSTWVPADQSYWVTRVAKAIDAGDTINSIDAVWKHDTLYLTDHSGHGGGQKNVNEFVGGEKYLGVKYEAKEYDDLIKQYYGWLRFNCTSQDSCYFKEYSSLKLVTAITKRLKDQLRVYPNPSGDRILLDLPYETDPQITITDVAGKIIPVHCTRNKSGYSFDISGLNPGIYLLIGNVQDQAFSARIAKAAD
jgi:hypothetical protein